MRTLSDLKKRLTKLEEQTGRKYVIFTMLDSTTRKMTNERLLEVLTESLPDDGIRGVDFETVISSVNNNASHRLVDLFLMCMD